MAKLLVLADDFTGALDTGVQFSSRGISTFVTVKDNTGFSSTVNPTFETEVSNDIISVASDMQRCGKVEDDLFTNQEPYVCIVDLESRHIPAEDAAGKVHRIVNNALHSGVEYFYKKTDSTLRGNIGAELSAMLKASDSGCLAFVPAYPKAGRTTRNGYQLVNDVPLHNTVFAKDPLNPIDESYIPAIIGKQSNCKAVLLKVSDDKLTIIDEEANTKVDIDVFFSGYECSRLSVSTEEPFILICDSSADEDMQRIGDILKKYGILYTTAGCAGFASVLPDLLELVETGKSKKTCKNKPRLHNDAILVICGSLNETSLKQIKHAENEGWYSISISPDILLQDIEGKSNMPESWSRTAEDIAAAIKQNGKAIIKTVDDTDQLKSYIRYGERLGLDKNEIHLRIAGNMGMLIKHLSNLSDIGAYAVFGGDTAFGIMKAMEWDGLIPRDEITPGVVISQIMHDRSVNFGSSKENYPDGSNENKRCTYLITKAGGFGDEDVLIKIEKYLKETGDFT